MARITLRHSLLVLRRKWRKIWHIHLLLSVILGIVLITVFWRSIDDRPFRNGKSRAAGGLEEIEMLKDADLLKQVGKIQGRPIEVYEGQSGDDSEKIEGKEDHPFAQSHYAPGGNVANVSFQMGSATSNDWISGNGKNVKGLAVGIEELMMKQSDWKERMFNGYKQRDTNKGEKCYIVGYNPAARSLWQMNSRALCYVEGLCFSGAHLEVVRTMGWLHGRGNTCHMMRAGDGSIVHSEWQELNRGNRCSRVVRENLVMKAFGTEVLDENNLDWLTTLEGTKYSSFGSHKMKGVEFKSKFAIVIPKYEWTHNICHYNRLWNYVAHVIRHLEDFGITYNDHEGKVEVLFRSGLGYRKTWMQGLRDALVDELERETGLSINVGKIRYDKWRKAQCLQKALLLGLEGRVDSFAFLNDTEIWDRSHNTQDEHWPIIPRQSLLLRQAITSKFNMPPMVRFSGKGKVTIAVPPKIIAYIVRNPRSRRRFGPSTKVWFNNTLHSMAREFGFEVHEVNFAGNMPMEEQVNKLRKIGIATGIHGANFVNTMFMPPGGALIEMFPFRYARAYYLNGGNAGLRYSYHETKTGANHGTNFLRYRESRLDFNAEDRKQVREVLKKAMLYIIDLHSRFPRGIIELQEDRRDDLYKIPK